MARCRTAICGTNGIGKMLSMKEHSFLLCFLTFFAVHSIVFLLSTTICMNSMYKEFCMETGDGTHG